MSARENPARAAVISEVDRGIGSSMQKEPNNFHFLRLFAAVLVLVSHLKILSGTKDSRLLTFLDSLDLGGFGLSIFFVISGYLVTQSWRSDPVPHRFAARRVLRILPGLIAVVLLTMLVLGPVVTKLSLPEYFSHPYFLRHLDSLLIFPMTFDLPGVFYDNPYPATINGSVWTLRYEATLYLLLPLFARPNLVNRATYWILVAALFIVASASTGAPSFRPPIIWFMSLAWLLYWGGFFFYGAALSVLQDRFGAPKLAVAGAFLVILIVVWQSQWSGLARLLLLGYVVVAIGVRSTSSLNWAGRYGDFSYGIYLYAFPVQQTLVHYGLAGNAFLNAFYVTTITLLFAVLSWFFVEKPALLVKPPKPLKDTP
jgi:peptidoglycan/LPS O-acetylase OafA/YrhL